MKTHYYTQDIINICDKKHLTVDEIFQYVKQKYPEAGRSSIYRNVEELVLKGDLKKITGIGKKSYFEKNLGGHIHLIDIVTGEIFDYKKDILLPDLPSGFKATNVDLKIFGEFSK